MITNDKEMNTSLQRIARFQEQVAHLRKVETNPLAYRLSAGGFFSEMARMQLDVRQYLSLLPSEAGASS